MGQVRRCRGATAVVIPAWAIVWFLSLLTVWVVGMLISTFFERR